MNVNTESLQKVMCRNKKTKLYFVWKHVEMRASSGTRFYEQIKRNLKQNGGKTQVWWRKGTAHDPMHSTVLLNGHVWLPMELARWCLLTMWPLTGWNLECMDLHTLLIFSQMLKTDRNWLHSADGWPQIYWCCKIQRFLKVKIWNVLQRDSGHWRKSWRQKDIQIGSYWMWLQ